MYFIDGMADLVLGASIAIVLHHLSDKSTKNDESQKRSSKVAKKRMKGGRKSNPYDIVKLKRVAKKIKSNLNSPGGENTKRNLVLFDTKSNSVPADDTKSNLNSSGDESNLNLELLGPEYTEYRKAMHALDKMGGKKEQKRLFDKLYNSLGEIEINETFCCTRNSKLFKVIQEGSAVLDMKQRSLIGTLAKSIRKIMCRDEGITEKTCRDFRDLLLMEKKLQIEHEYQGKKDQQENDKMQKRNEIEHEAQEKKDQQENDKIQKRNKTEMLEKIKTLSLDLVKSSVIAGISSGALYAAFSLIPENIENFVEFSASLGCQTNEDEETTWFSNPVSCRNPLGEIFANAVSSLFVSLGNISAGVTGDIAQFICLVLFAVLFIFFMTIQNIQEVSLLGFKIKQK